MNHFPDIGTSDYSFTLAYNTQSFESPLTRSTQTASLPGDQWQGVVTYSNKTGVDARTLKSFVLGLGGQVGRFNFTPPDLDQQSEAVFPVVVNGGGQIGSSIDIEYQSPIASLDISSQEISPEDMVVSANGLVAFIIGTSSDSIHQYDMTTANDLSTAVYSGNSLNINAQDTNSRGVTISNDGMTIFIIGTGSLSIHQYNLSIANDLSTAVYSGNSFNVSGEDSAPASVSVSSNGLVLIVSGDTSNAIYQYDMSSPNDITTTSYSGNSINVTSQDSNPLGISLSGDGMTFFMSGNSSNSLYQYDMTASNDLSTAVYSGNSFNVSSYESTPTGVSVSFDGGTIMFIGVASDSIFSLSMSIQDDLSTAATTRDIILLFGVGDYLTVNGELKSVLADVSTNEFGFSTVRFAPPLRRSPPDLSPIEVEKPFMIAKLEDDAQTSFQVSTPIIYNASFSVVEVF